MGDPKYAVGKQRYRSGVGSYRIPGSDGGGRLVSWTADLYNVGLR